MTRALSAGLISELTASLCRPIMLFEGVFESLTLRLSTGNGDISWNGETWLGNGWLREWSGPQESDDFAKNNLEIILTGVPELMLALIMAGIKQGAAGKFYFGMLNAAGAVITSPYLLFEGKLDVPVLDEGQEDSQITLTYENEYTSVNRSKESRWEPETQKMFYPSDLGFQYVTATQEWNGTWGPKKQEPRTKNKSTKPKKKRGSKT